MYLTHNIDHVIEQQTMRIQQLEKKFSAKSCLPKHFIENKTLLDLYIEIKRPSQNRFQQSPFKYAIVLLTNCRLCSMAIKKFLSMVNLTDLIHNIALKFVISETYCLSLTDTSHASTASVIPSSISIMCLSIISFCLSSFCTSTYQRSVGLS